MVERYEVSHLLGLLILNYVGVDNSLSWNQYMSDLFLLHLGHHLVLSQVFLEQGKNLWDIFGLHLSDVVSFV